MAQIKKLTAIQVRNLTQRGLHSDGAGLYLSVSTSGSKSWRYIYKRRRKRTEIGLGSFPAVSLGTARERAEELSIRRAQGELPRTYWSDAEDTCDVPTFGELATEYVDQREDSWKNAKHRQQWRNTLENYAVPVWETPVDEVAVDDLMKILQPIWLTKHETASRVRGRIEAVLDAAKVLGHRQGENPATWRGNLALLLPRVPKGPIKHHAAMPHTSMPTFMRELREADGLAAKALELLIYTAARTAEVLDAEWSEFDLEGRLWIIPASRMKAGKEHRVPLSPPALKLLKALPEECPLVFPGAKAGRPLSNMSMTQVLRRMQVENATVHGFRSTFRDWAGDVAQAPREVAEACLAHQVGSEVERAYRRGDALNQRRDLMDQWAEYLVT